MLDIGKDLAKAKREQREVVNRINQLNAEKGGLIQEALKLEGDIRTLRRLAKESSKIQEN